MSVPRSARPGRHGRGPATQRAYRTDWAIFGTWCDRVGREALPATPATVAAFVEAQARAGLAPATLRRRLAAIRAHHLARGYGNPTEDDTVADAVAGVCAERAATGSDRAPRAPILPERLAALVSAIPADTPEGLRDRALLLVGFAGAFRRSELVGIRAEWLEWRREGVIVALPGRATGRGGGERAVPIVRGRTLCPVAALRAWLDASGITAGPVFRSFTPRGALRDTAMRAEVVSRKLKRDALAAGVPPREVERLAAHSLRAGFVAAALANGADVFRVMEVSGHLSPQSVRGYLRSARPFYDHAGEGLL